MERKKEPDSPSGSRKTYDPVRLHTNAMDGLTLRAAVAEVNALRGKRLDAVAAPEAHEIQLVFEHGPRVVLSAHPAHNTLYVAPEPNPGGETRFGTRIQRGLERCRFDKAVQLGLDRVVVLSFSRRDRLGDTETRNLVAELIGKGANLLLVEGDVAGGRILEQLRPGRQGNGDRYRPPESTKADLTRDDREALVKALRNALAEGKSGAEAVLAAWAGPGPVSAAEVAARAGSGSDAGLLADTWIAFAEATAPGKGDRPRGKEFLPVILRRKRSVEAVCFRPEPAAGVETVEASTVSEAAAGAAEIFRGSSSAGAGTPRRKALRQAMKRVERALEEMKMENEESKAAPRLRETGNLLLAYAHEIPRGRAEVELADPEGGEPMRVRLNPKLSPAQNAELYFKRARKTERRSSVSGKRRSELEERLRELKALEDQDPGSGAEPGGDWFQEARRLGVKLPRTDLAKDPKATPEDLLPSNVRPRIYTLENGWELLVGKSNRGNEVLTHEIARPGDVWMHADQAAGSHAVLRHHEKGKEPPRSVVLAAAAIAAYFSKARNAGKVPVLVTHKRHVRRARKAPVGTVMVGQHETVMVRPTDPDREKDNA